MPISGGGFEQCCNAQAAVDADSPVIVISDVTQHTNDKEEMVPALEALENLPEALPRPDELLADAGYYSEDNVDACAASNIDAYIPSRREPHYQDVIARFQDDETAKGVPAEEKPPEQMKQRMKSKEGKAIFAKRKCTIEPVFGIIKAVMGFRQFFLRGLRAVPQEWQLVCIAYNLKRLHKMGLEA